MLCCKSKKYIPTDLELSYVKEDTMEEIEDTTIEDIIKDERISHLSPTLQKRALFFEQHESDIYLYLTWLNYSITKFAQEYSKLYNISTQEAIQFKEHVLKIWNRDNLFELLEDYFNSTCEIITDGVACTGRRRFVLFSNKKKICYEHTPKKKTDSFIKPLKMGEMTTYLLSHGTY